MNFRTAYNFKTEEDFSTHNTEESMTQQDDANETDINVIVARFTKTGQLPQLQAAPLSGDFTTALDFRECQERLHAANMAFAEIPAKIRSRFNNDPAEFIEFASNKDNLDELRKLGLANPAAPPPKEPEPIKVIVTNPEPKP